MCDEGIPNSVLEVGNFWRVHAYNIGGLVFSLDDLEHGILRGKDDGNSLFLHYKVLIFAHFPGKSESRNLRPGTTSFLFISQPKPCPKLKPLIWCHI